MFKSKSYFIVLVFITQVFFSSWTVPLLLMFLCVGGVLLGVGCNILSRNKAALVGTHLMQLMELLLNTDFSPR